MDSNDQKTLSVQENIAKEGEKQQQVQNVGHSMKNIEGGAQLSAKQMQRQQQQQQQLQQSLGIAGSDAKLVFKSEKAAEKKKNRKKAKAKPNSDIIIFRRMINLCSRQGDVGTAIIAYDAQNDKKKKRGEEAAAATAAVSTFVMLARSHR
jgi:hypothetical protein